MRTAESIEAQSEIAANQTGSEPNAVSKETGVSSGKAPWLKPYHFKPGQSGNPKGGPKRDASADVAKRIFENNEEAIYEALGKALLKGNAYAFTQLAERGYGKLKEKLEVSGLDSVAEKLAAARKRRAK